MTLTLLGTPCKWNGTAFVLLRLASFTWRFQGPSMSWRVSGRPSFLRLSNIPLCGWTVPLSRDRHLGCCHLAGIVSNTAATVGLCFRLSWTFARAWGCTESRHVAFWGPAAAARNARGFHGRHRRSSFLSFCSVLFFGDGHPNRCEAVSRRGFLAIRISSFPRRLSRSFAHFQAGRLVFPPLGVEVP